MDNIQFIVDSVRHIAGDEPYHFDSPVQIPADFHSVPVNIWAIWLSPKDNIYLMDAEEHWYQLASPDRNYDLVVMELVKELTKINLIRVHA